MSIGCAVLMCHAPIVLPAIAGPRASACKATTRAMTDVARTLCMHEPELVVLVSPHAPRRREGFGLSHAATLDGSFARFGHPELALRIKGAPEAARRVEGEAEARGVPCHRLAERELDHGALVPLSFLHEAGYRGPVLLVSLPFPGTATEQTFGAAVAQASGKARWAILASGDMSHRLTPDAPAGFDPEARRFDERFVARLRAHDVQGAVAVDEALVERAAEDVVQSTAVALGAAGEPRGVHVLSYEGPFGVGYCEAVLHSDRVSTKASTPPDCLLDVARDAIAAALAVRPYEPPRLDPPWDRPRAVFVTLRSPAGELRGCIGRVDPVHASLAQEVADCAVSSATRDMRMEPVSADEVASLGIEVSVLEPPEPIEDRSALDPARYGVVVSHGRRRGVLLPDVEGVNSAEEQVRIALHKGGISEDAPYALSRFRVHKVRSAPHIGP